MNIPTREERIAKMQKTCIHFNGLYKKVCRAGVSYDSLPNGIGLPCLSDERCAGLCDKEQFPTIEECEARLAAMEQGRLDMRTARKAIMEVAGDRRRVQGRIKCPVCPSGVLGFSIASNGHVHARCSSEGCVCWME